MRAKQAGARGRAGPRGSRKARAGPGAREGGPTGLVGRPEIEPDAGAMQSARDIRAEAVARALTSWARSLEARSKRTAKRYGAEARAFGEFIEAARGPFPDGLLSASAADCRAFVFLGKLAPASRAVRAAVLRSMYGCLVVEGVLSVNPAADVKVKHARSGKHHKAVPKATVERVLSELAESERPKDIRDRAILLTFLVTGARLSEVASMKMGDIDREEGGEAFLTIHGKGGKVARMLLRPGALLAIDRWLAVSGHVTGPRSPLFVNMSHRPEHCGKAIKPEGLYQMVKARLPDGFSPHSLRSRAISDCWSASGQNLHMAQLFARHSSPTVTEQVYIQARKLEAALRFAPDYS